MSDRNGRMARRWNGGRNALLSYKRGLAQAITPGARVLHAGCGWDRNDVLTSYRESCEIIGVDVDQRIAARYHSTFLLASVDDLPFAPASFDVILCDYVIEHLQHPERFFAESARLLKPGGRLLLLTPNAYSYKSLVARLTPHGFHRAASRLRFGAGSEDDAYPTVYRCNSARALNRALTRAGFTHVTLEHVNNGPTWFEKVPVLFEVADAVHALADRTHGLDWAKCALIATATR